MTNFQRLNSNRKPQPFRPNKLARSVIAVPLLEQIEQELDITQKVLKQYPQLNETHNTAIFLRSNFPGDAEAALKQIRDLLPEVAEIVGAKTAQSLDSTPVESEFVSGAVVLASLEGPVIRQLLRMAAADRLSAVERIWPTRFTVIIDINLNFNPFEIADDLGGKAKIKHPDQRLLAKTLIQRYIDKAKKAAKVNDPDQCIDTLKTEMSNQYVFATLEGKVIQKLVEIDQKEAQKLCNRAKQTPQNEDVEQALRRTGEATDRAIETVPESERARFRTIHHIWPDFEVRSCVTRSIRTIKVDAARNSFTASGDGVTWAVMDTGIDGLHPHFALHKNIDVASPYHADFTNAPGGPSPLEDKFGHGTHVAGIIAGEQFLQKDSKDKDAEKKMLAVSQELDANNETTTIRKMTLEAISGMAPKCKLVSIKVLDEFGMGNASNVIAAIAHVQRINGHGRDLKIHGVNLSLGHSFDPKWFACGHSPLCVEVNRLVKSGVVVVVAAGNTGYGTLQTNEGGSDTCLDLTINDPGNAECAITVGSTHRDSPHMYGVSYFSSKGPTGDGRYKPDLLAPGEKIISCAAANSTLVADEFGDHECAYFENSGTSMAAPHVSGAIAAFLSIRSEFIGEAEKIKQIFTSTATDLGRDRYFQGFGLVDLMRAIQSV
ncbi:S8 family peptidase [Altericista sp. CCNU0014]|uniref:S8 family peptidase n=1 Tax=Altericista sp. CCNU0014 TaxID=3082949 RepID=UPI00384EEB77